MLDGGGGYSLDGGTATATASGDIKKGNLTLGDYYAGSASPETQVDKAMVYGLIALGIVAAVFILRGRK